MANQKLQAQRGAAVTPSNTENIPSISGGTNNGAVLYVGQAGNLRVLTSGGDDITLVGVNTGAFIPIQVVRVFSTGTSAAQIIALW